MIQQACLFRQPPHTPVTDTAQFSAAKPKSRSMVLYSSSIPYGRGISITRLHTRHTKWAWGAVVAS